MKPPLHDPLSADRTSEGTKRKVMAGQTDEDRISSIFRSPCADQWKYSLVMSLSDV